MLFERPTTLLSSPMANRSSMSVIARAGSRSGSPSKAATPPLVDFLVEVMQHLPLFADAKPEALVALAQLSTAVEFAAGDVVISRSEPSSELYIVLEGEYGPPEAAEGEVASSSPHLTRGDCFGELAFRCDAPPTEPVVCLKGGVLHSVDRTALDSAFMRRYSNSPTKSSTSPTSESLTRRGSGGSGRGYLLTKIEKLMTSAYEDRTREQDGAFQLASKNALQGSIEAILLQKFREIRTLDLTIKAWDKDRTGSIRSAEFQRELSNAGIRAATAEVDRLLKVLEDEASGAVQLEAFKRYVLDLKEQTASTNTALTRQRELVTSLRRYCSLAEEALRTEELASRAEGTLVSLEDDVTVEVRLWLLLKPYHSDLAKMVHKWDSNGDGFISRGEFRQHVRKLGLVAQLKEIDAAFATIDEDGRNRLTVTEMRSFIGKWQREVDEQVKQHELAHAARLAKVREKRERAWLATAALLAEVTVAQRRDAMQAVWRGVPLYAKLAEIVGRAGMEEAVQVFRTVTTVTGEKRRVLLLEDFVRAVRQLGMEAGDEQLADLFKQFDPHRNGQLDSTQMRDVLKQLLASANQAARAMAEATKAYDDACRQAAAMREQLTANGELHEGSGAADPMASWLALEDALEETSTASSVGVGATARGGLKEGAADDEPTGEDDSLREASSKSLPERQLSDGAIRPTRQRSDSTSPPPRRYLSEGSLIRPTRPSSEGSLIRPVTKQLSEGSLIRPVAKQLSDGGTSPPRRQLSESGTSPPRRQLSESGTSPPRRQLSESSFTRLSEGSHKSERLSEGSSERSKRSSIHSEKGRPAPISVPCVSHSPPSVSPEARRSPEARNSPEARTSPVPSSPNLRRALRRPPSPACAGDLLRSPSPASPETGRAGARSFSPRSPHRSPSPDMRRSQSPATPDTRRRARARASTSGAASSSAKPPKAPDSAPPMPAALSTGALYERPATPPAAIRRTNTSPSPRRTSQLSGIASGFTNRLMPSSPKGWRAGPRPQPSRPAS